MPALDPAIKAKADALFADADDVGQTRALYVLRDGAAKALHLPGHIITLHRSLIEPQESGELAAGFALAVQWHPEWQVEDNPQSLRLFGAFGQACRDYQEQHRKTE